MVEALNNVKIEGILSEIDLNYGTYDKRVDGQVKSIETIGGQITIKVEQDINKQHTVLDIPVHMFAQKYTNAGKPNPAYSSIETLMNDFVSIAASDYEHADAVRITSGKIRMNEYYKDDRLISFPRIEASFVQKIKRSEMKFAANFSANFVVGSKDYETDKEGNETGRYLIHGILPQYGNRVDVVPFYAINENAIESIANYWEPYSTVSAIGKLNFTSKTETYTTNVDFGEPEERTRTVNVSEIIITGGREAPLDDDIAYTRDEIDAALADRKVRLEQSKNKGAKVKTDSPAQKRPNLGF